MLRQRLFGVVTQSKRSISNSICSRLFHDNNDGYGYYNSSIEDHCRNPRNFGSFDRDDPDVGTGYAASKPPAVDSAKLQIKVERNTRIIFDTRIFPYGSASVSLASESIKGMKIEEALQIKGEDILKHLSLPVNKDYCGLFVERAISEAIKDYEEKCEKQMGGSSASPAGTTEE